MANPTLKRPISPHLQIYKPQLTSGLSILNRVTGVGIGFGLLFMLLWLGAAAYGPETYAAIYPFLTSWFGWLVCFGVSAIFYYHFFNGIRFMFWDLGYGFEMSKVVAGGITMLLFAFGATVLTWGVVLLLI